MAITTFVATTGRNLALATRSASGEWSVETRLDGVRVFALTHDSQSLYAGTEDGVLRSDDGGVTWQPAGLSGIIVKALAVTPAAPGRVLAGTRPPMVLVSDDRGENWEELTGFRKRRQWWWFTPAEPPFHRAYVNGLAVSPGNPDVILAGIEFGAVLRSTDGGQTWSKHCKGADRDCHCLTFHGVDGDWVYEGGGFGASLSSDAGATWSRFGPPNLWAAVMEYRGQTREHQGLDRYYGWAVAGDAQQPSTWYFSASTGPMYAHGETGDARAHLYRCRDGQTMEKLSGGLPDPLPYMPYALIPDADQTGHLYAGMSNGDIWHTRDYGDSWSQLGVNVGGIHRAMIGF